MNVFTNEAYYDAQVKRSRLLRTGGILSIIISFALSLLVNLNPYLVCGAYPFLIIGLPMWTMGRSAQRRLASMPRPDKQLNEELKGLSNKYTLHHYLTIQGRMVKHLLVMPSGLLVLESRESPGPVGCSTGRNGDAWRAKSGFLDRISGTNPAIGNPSADLAASIGAASSTLVEVGKTAVPVMGMIVFTRNPVISSEGCTYAAIPLNEVKDTVRDLVYELGGEKVESGKVDTILTTEDRRKLNALLQPPKPVAPTAATTRRTVDDRRT